MHLVTRNSGEVYADYGLTWSPPNLKKIQQLPFQWYDVTDPASTVGTVEVSTGDHAFDGTILDVIIVIKSLRTPDDTVEATFTFQIEYTAVYCDSLLDL